MTATDEREVKVTIEYIPVFHMWSWHVVIGADIWGGYEYDYLNAEGSASDILREQGVDE